MTGKNIYKAEIGRREWVPNVSIVKIAARNPMERLMGGHGRKRWDRQANKDIIISGLSLLCQRLCCSVEKIPRIMMTQRKNIE